MHNTHISFKLKGITNLLNGRPLKVLDQLIYFGSKISSIENDVNTRIGKAWATIDKLSIGTKCFLFDRVKQEFFQVIAISELLYGCTS